MKLSTIFTGLVVAFAVAMVVTYGMTMLGPAGSEQSTLSTIGFVVALLLVWFAGKDLMKTV